MGAWGYKYYENDEAADWFHSFWSSKDFTLIEELVTTFDLTDEGQCDQLRAAAHVLTAFDSPYTCPGDFWDHRDEIVRKTISYLEAMIDPSRADNYFLDMWDGAEEIITEVQGQIAQLKASGPDACG